MKSRRPVSVAGICAGEAEVRSQNRASILRQKIPGQRWGSMVQSDQETKLEAQGKFLEALLGGRRSPSDEATAVNRALNRALEKRAEIV